MKKGNAIIYTVIGGLIVLILFSCFLLIHYNIQNNKWRLGGVFIEEFNGTTEKEFLSEFNLDKYDYIELSDVYSLNFVRDPYYIVSFKVSKENVEKFKNDYLNKCDPYTVYDTSTYLPNREYTFKDCNEYIDRTGSYDEAVIIFEKEHSNNDYYEYHLRNTVLSYNDNIRHLIREQFDKKNYRVIGMLKSVYD